MATSNNPFNTENSVFSTSKRISFKIGKIQHKLSDVEKVSASSKSSEISGANSKRKSILDSLRKEKLSQKNSCYTLDTFKSSHEEKIPNDNETATSSSSSELLKFKKQNIDIKIRKAKIINMLKEIEKMQKDSKCNKSHKELDKDSKITDEMQDHIKNINRSLRESEETFEKTKKIQNQIEVISFPSKNCVSFQEKEKMESPNSYASQCKFVDQLLDNNLIDHRESEMSAIDNESVEESNHRSVIDPFKKNGSLLDCDSVEMEMKESECNIVHNSEIVSQLSNKVSCNSSTISQRSNIPSIITYVPSIKIECNISPLGKPFKSYFFEESPDMSIGIKIPSIESSQVSHFTETSSCSNLCEPTNISDNFQIAYGENPHFPLEYEEISEEMEDGEIIDLTVSEESVCNYRKNSFPNQTKNLTLTKQLDASTSKLDYYSHRSEYKHNFSFSLQAIMEQNNYPHHPSQFSERVWSSQVDDFLNGNMKPFGPEPLNAHAESLRSQSRPDSRKSFQSTDPYKHREPRSPYSRSKHHKKSSKSSSSKRKPTIESSSKSRRPSLSHSQSPSASSYSRVARYPREEGEYSDREDDNSHKKDKIHKKHDTKYRSKSKSKERSKKSKKSKKKRSKHSKKNHKDKPRSDSFSSDFSESEIPVILESTDKYSSSKLEDVDKKSSSSSAFNLNDISTLLKKYGNDDQEICETIRKEIIKERALEKESCAKIFKSKIKNRGKARTDEVEPVTDDKIDDSKKLEEVTERSDLSNVCEVADLDVEKFNSDDFWNLLDIELPVSELNVEQSASENSDSEMSPNQGQDEILPFIELENEENISPNLLHSQAPFYGKVLELLSTVSNHLGPLEASILTLNTEFRALSPEEGKDLLVKNEQLFDTVLKSIDGLIENSVTDVEDLILFEVVRDELNMTMKSITHHSILSKCYGLNLNQIASNATEMDPSQIKELIKHSLLYEGYANIPHKDFSSIHNTVLDIRAKLS